MVYWTAISPSSIEAYYEYHLQPSLSCSWNLSILCHLIGQSAKSCTVRSNHSPLTQIAVAPPIIMVLRVTLPTPEYDNGTAMLICILILIT